MNTTRAIQLSEIWFCGLVIELCSLKYTKRNQSMRHTVTVGKISTRKCQRATGIRQPYTVTTSMTKNFNPTMSPHIGMHQSHSLTRFEKSPVRDNTFSDQCSFLGNYPPTPPLGQQYYLLIT